MSLFNKLQAQAFRRGLKARSAEARTWFRAKIKELGEVNPHKVLDDSAVTQRQRPEVGQLHHFFYGPKHAEILPYFDRFPLIIMVGPAEKGFYGLNLHYLSPMVRAKFLDKLSETANNKRYDESTKLKISYNLLQSVNKYKEFRPCFKHYLTSHVESKIVKIDASEWEIVIFLNTEQFVKKGKQNVWAESKRMIKK